MRRLLFKNSHEHISLVALFLGLGLSVWLIFWNLGKGSIDLRDEALTAGRSLYIYHTHRIRVPNAMFGLATLSTKSQNSIGRTTTSSGGRRYQK